MTKVDMVKLYNMISWYFCNTQYPHLETKMSDSCSKLFKELKEMYEQNNNNIIGKGE